MGQKLGELKMDDETTESTFVGDDDNTSDDEITDGEIVNADDPMGFFPEEIAQTLVDLEAKIDYVVGVANKLDKFLEAMAPMLEMFSGMNNNGAAPNPLNLMRLAMG
jgi:hypothetical protein